MIDEIRQQIETLRCRAKPQADSQEDEIFFVAEDSDAMLSAADTLEKLLAVYEGAGEFIKQFKPEIIEHHGYPSEWNAMCDAYFSAQTRQFKHDRDSPSPYDLSQQDGFGGND